MSKGNLTKRTPESVTITPIAERVRKETPTAEREPLIFGKSNYVLMGVGALLVAIGLLLMSGGRQAPDTWDPNVIYSTRIVTLAPMVILSGLIVEIYAIFKD